MAFEARFVRVPRLAAAAIAAWLLLPAAAGAINVCGDGVCQKTGIPVENATNCPADCGGGSTEPRLPSVLLGLTSCAWGAADCNPPLTGSSAIHQVNNLFTGQGQAKRSHLLEKTGTQSVLNMSWHWQSIQRAVSGTNGRFLAVTASIDNAPGRLYVFEVGEEPANGDPFGAGSGQVGANRSLIMLTADNRSSSDGKRRNHAGGSQLLGRILGVGVECHKSQSICSGLNAAVAFHDLSTPAAPAARGNFELPYTNAGTVSLAKLSTGEYLMIVGEGDAAKLNFYTSTSPTSGWTFRESWSKSTDTVFTSIGDSNYGAYQNLHLVTDATDGGRLYLVATHNDSALANGDDWVDLYRVESVAGQARLTKVAKRHIWCDSFCNLDAGGGAYVTPAGRLVVYGIEHYPDGCGQTCTRTSEYAF